MGAAQTSKMTEEKATQNDNLLNAVLDHTTQAVIDTEMFILAQTMDKYCHCVSDQLLAMDDEALRDFIQVDKFTGWGIYQRMARMEVVFFLYVWKLGQETEAFETFCTVMK